MLEKSSVLQIRISQKLKTELEDICKKLGAKQPSVQVRELIEQFVLDNHGYLNDRVTVHIYRPDGYDLGVWRIAMSLRDPGESIWMGAAIPFRFPKLPMRRFQSDKGFEAVVGVPSDTDFANYELGGVFVDGKWYGHVYSNGCPESMNQTSIDEVAQSLRKLIVDLFDRFSKRK